MNAPFGHNETAVRLGLLADDARKALARVESGESTAIEGWLAYGAAMNEGRALFPGKENDRSFGEWCKGISPNLGDIHDDERAAAMWAAGNPDQFAEARAAGNARTVRGIHAKWKEIEAAREIEADRRRADEARAEAASKAAAETEARREAQEARDEETRRDAEMRAEQFRQERKEADRRAREAQNAVDRRDPFYHTEREVVVSPKPHVAHNSGDNEWYTPAPFVEAARTVMGRFDLDPASSEIANRTVQAARIFTAEDDGLAQEWPVGTIWMNPPYAQPLMGQFADRFAAEIRRGSEGVVLVNNATETAWFQTIAAECSAICFPKSRIRFLDPEGNPGAPLQGQAIIYCGPNPDAFEAAFSGFGLVVRHG
jgi:phage N-6-adenine-methyltransferase